MAIHIAGEKKLCLYIGDQQTNNHLYRLPQKKKVAKNLLEKNKELSI